MIPRFLAAATRLAVLTACSGSLHAVAWAQVEDDAVTVPVTFYAQFYTLGGSSSISVVGPGGASATGSTTYPSPVWLVTNQAIGQLRPGKDYLFTVTVQNMQQWRIRLSPPAGSRLYVEDVEGLGANYAMSVGYYSHTVKVRVENGMGAGPGEASGLRPGRVIWSVGLGELKSGAPAGVISLRESGLSATAYKPDALLYDHSSNEVSRVFVSGTSTLRQVFAPQCLADIVTVNAYTYDIKFYGRPQVGSQVGGVWQVSGTPFVVYRIENSSYPSTTKLKITKTANYGGTKSWWTEIEKTGADWKVTDWNETGQTVLGTVRYGYGDLDRDETIEARNGSYTTTYARSKNRFEDFAWGRELTSSQVGFGGSNPLITTFTYETNSSAWGAFTKTKWRVDSTENWEAYSYNTEGLVSAVYRPFGDTPATPQNTSISVGEVSSIAYIGGWDGIATRPSLVVNRINNTVTSQIQTAYDESTTRLSRYDSLPPPNDPQTLPLIVATRKDYSSSGSYLTTTVTSYREDAEPGARRLPGLPHSIQRPDGTMEVHLYFKGNFSLGGRSFATDVNGTAFAEYVIQGTTSSSGAQQLSSYGPSDQSNYIAGNFYVVPGQSTMQITVRDFNGQLAMTQSWIYTGTNPQTNWVLVDRGVNEFDSTYQVFPTKVTRDSGSTTDVWTVSESGWQYGRIQWSADGSGAKRWFTYDAKGRVTQERLESITGQPQAGEQWTIHSFDPANRETQTKLSTNGTGGDAANDVVTETDFDLAGRPTQSRQWGESAWLATAYTYYVGANPRISQLTHPGGATTISEVYRDGRAKSVTGTAQPPQYFSYWAQTDGRIRSQQRLASAADGDGWMDTYTDWLGRISEEVRPTTSGHTKDQRIYNGSGQLERRQLFDNGWQPLLASTRYVYNSMGAVIRSGMDVTENGVLDDTGADRVTTTSYNFVSVESAWWRETTTKTFTNTANTTDGVATTVRERLTGKTASLQAETRAIDANNQTTTEKTLVDRTNKTVTGETTVPGSTITGKKITKNGFLAQTISSEGIVTTYTYDVYGRPTMTQGRQSVLEETVYWPKSTLVKNVRNAVLKPSVIGTEWQEFYYDSAGRLWKHRTNNVGSWKTARYAYNSMGQRTRQWGDAVNPAEFVYNTYGWRTQMKLYRGGSGWNTDTWPASPGTADTTTWAYHGATGLVTSKTDPASRTVSFTYNNRNQVATRTWARGVVTTYGYANSAGFRTGQPTTISYSDGTPTVTFSYQDSGAYLRHGLPRYIYDATGAHTFGYRFNDLQPDYERFDQGFFGIYSGSGRDIWRAYDSLGRSTGFDAGWGVDHTAIQQVRYYYNNLDGSSQQTGRVGDIYLWRPQTGGRTFTYTYRPASNLLDKVESGSFKHENQWATWRNLQDHVRTYWSTTTKSSFHYDYDWVEQRIGEDHNDELATQLGYTGGIDTDYLFTSKGEVDWVNATRISGGAQINDRYRDWTYDEEGNRSIEYYSGGNRAFTPNNLNQYSAVAGVTHSYDFDGNLTNDGVWWYYWDGENRLKTVQKQDNTKRLEFTYDYMGRRVRTVVRNGGAGAAIASDRRFLYDGWNVIAELDALQGGSAYTCVRTFSWGLDLTGTIHGAGGIGGLLMIGDGSATHLPVYDANGNVRGLLNGSTGAWTAAYGYSAFGEVLQADGTYAASNPIRFASKWQDSETGLYSYNHRIYSAKLGRFISRDPIAENGGLNLYGAEKGSGAEKGR